MGGRQQPCSADHKKKRQQFGKNIPRTDCKITIWYNESFCIDIQKIQYLIGTKVLTYKLQKTKQI